MTRTQSVSYHDEGTPLTGFYAWGNTSGGKRPGILVIHGGAGLDQHARNRAERLAEIGYVAFACDMYGDGVAGNRERVIARVMELSGNPDLLCQRARAAIGVLAAHPLVDGRLAAVGYCFGGMTVLQLARSGMELAGVASIHGGLKTTRPAQVSAVKAKILVCHGALDPHVPMTDLTAFMEEMKAAGADWQINVYGNASHGFTHEDAVPSRIPSMEYNAVADSRSSAALHAFLAELFYKL